MPGAARRGKLAGLAALVAVIAVVAGVVVIAAQRSQDVQSSGSYIYAWTADADSADSDFLAVIDADPQSAGYLSIVATVPVGARAVMPHHTEHAVVPRRELWASGFAANRVYRFDISGPAQPRLVGETAVPSGFIHPHSFERLPDGRVLATYQQAEGAGGGHYADHRAELTGGLVEFDSGGRVLRTASASTPLDPGIRPYSLVVVPSLDRIVTTATDMHLQTRSSAVQVWRLSDLRLLHTIFLPPGPDGSSHAMSAEPRLLADGRTVMVNTFTCGLYTLAGLDSDRPTAALVYTAGIATPPFCAIPVVVGQYWIQAQGPARAIAVLDATDPLHPVQVSRLQLDDDEIPHWLSADATGTRVIITGYVGLANRLLVARFDTTNGRLSLDSTFRSPGAARPGVSFAPPRWPHGATGPAVPHAAVFSR